MPQSTDDLPVLVVLQTLQRDVAQLWVCVVCLFFLVCLTLIWGL